MKISGFDGKYRFLSNFYEAPVSYNGIVYTNNEAAFQAQKDPARQKEFADLNASEARRLGRRVTLRKDWEQIKISVMKGIVRAKFEQNPDLADKLLDTEDSYLEEENSWGDRIWGTVNGQGANNLGIILMEVRELIKDKNMEQSSDLIME